MELPPGRALFGAREGRAPVRERLMAMLFLAALLHAIVIVGLTFSAGDHGSADEAPSLEVLLVTNEVPTASRNDPATYLAQRTQLGSGNSAAPLPAASPAPALPAAERAPERASAAAAAADAEVLHSSAPSADIRYLTPGHAAAAAAAAQPEVDIDAGAPRSGRGDAPELLLRGASRRDLWVTPDTRASKLAPYLIAWKRKVERVGTLNFPTAARDAGLSGSPVVEVNIRADGRLAQARVRRSSGYRAIDEAALTILKLASPFDPFPPELAADYQALRFAYQWEFVAGRLQSGAVTTSADGSRSP
jgi:protein TonB